METEKKRFNQIFAMNLRKSMAKKDIKQSELAKLMGVSTATVSDWYNGNKTPRSYHIEQLCHILQCTPASLMLEPMQRTVEQHDVIMEAPRSIKIDEKAPFERDDYKVLIKYLQLTEESKRFVEAVIDRELGRQQKTTNGQP